MKFQIGDVIGLDSNGGVAEIYAIGVTDVIVQCGPERFLAIECDEIKRHWPAGSMNLYDVDAPDVLHGEWLDESESLEEQEQRHEADGYKGESVTPYKNPPPLTDDEEFFGVTIRELREMSQDDRFALFDKIEEDHGFQALEDFLKRYGA